MDEEMILRNFVFERLKPAVETELKHLEEANADNDLSEVSWRTRNLFELLIWTEHCSKSEEAAKGFCEDAMRDGVDVMKTPKTLTLGRQMNDLRATVVDVAKQLGLDGIEEAYTRVANVAQELGWGDIWRFTNKGLSKLAHPTAFAVIYPLTGENEKSTRMYFYSLGVVLGNHALQIINAQSASE
ncbi:MAG: hypothetical protein WDO73_21280 [Ignavibacteriota bacterium]